MSLADLKSQLPDYAKDLRLNLESVLTEGGAPGLTQKQIAVIALASAIASRYKPLTAAINEESAKHASAEELNGARVAASIMGMNNVLYRGRAFLDGKYDDLRPGLRMNIIGNPGVDKANFELWSFAVSSINGCSHCVAAHEHTLREAGVEREAILEALKVAAIVTGVAQAITTAQTLAAAG